MRGWSVREEGLAFMQRRRLFHRRCSLALTPLQWTFVEYFAHEYELDVRDVVRGVIEQFALGHREFEVGRYKRFVTEKLVEKAREQEDEVFVDELLRQVEEHLEVRKGGKKGKKRYDRKLCLEVS